MYLKLLIWRRIWLLKPILAADWSAPRPPPPMIICCRLRFPAVERKKVTAAFDGGRLSSDGGVMLLSQAERCVDRADRLAAVIPDERDASRVIHRLPDILRARIFAIACGYEDADDLDRLRSDPTFKLPCRRLPDTGTDQS